MTIGPGWKKHPDHRIFTKPAGVRVQVASNGEFLADTDDAIRLEETGHDPVFYIPRKDARMDRLVRSSHRTHCPFKGEASYFSVKDGPQDAVWTYEQPYDEMPTIKDYLAFYPDKVEIRGS